MKTGDKKMNALLPDGAGGVLWAETDAPTLRDGEVLVKVEAAGINRADLAQLAGHYPPPAGESEIVGLEVAGRVAELGRGAEALIGAPVCALLAGGGYAELVAVPAALLMPVPDGWTFAEAAGLPEVAFTAFLNLFLEAGLAEGEVVLVHGGASGLGSFAIKLAKLAGATVVSTAGGPTKVRACEELGADVAIDRHEGPWRPAVERAVGKVDVILDMVGASYFQANMGVLATGGRLVSIATLGGREAELDLGVLMVKRARIIGSTLRARPLPEKVRIKEAFLERFGARLTDGHLKPLIDTVVPVSEANEAHARMRANDTVGKLILQVPT